MIKALFEFSLPARALNTPSLALCAFLLLCPQANAQQAVERGAEFRASDLLPGARLLGPNYVVQERVQNDGFVNHYTVSVDGGSYIVSGNALMRQRLDELAALQTMRAVERTDVYKSSLKKAAGGALRTVKGLATSPVQTVQGVATGFGTFFKGVGHSIFGGASNQEEGVLKTMIGFDAVKRKFAYKFGVDPYTSFPPVKERLEEISWTGVAGNLTVTAAFQPLSKGARAAAKMAKTSDAVKQLVRDTPPVKLKEINARKLKAMDVDETAAELFLEHPSFSPTQKTFLVEALARVGVHNRQAFIKRAILVQNEEMAFFMRRWAEMIAAYHTHIQPSTRLVRVGKAPFLQRQDGVIVGLFPVDYISWNENIAGRYATSMKDIPNVQNITGGEMWFEGGVSPKARQILESANWKVYENVGGTLKLDR